MNHRLLNLNVESLSRLPHKLPEFVQQYQLEKGVLPTEKLRILRNFAVLKEDHALLEVVLQSGCDAEPYPEGLNPLHLADDYNSGPMVEMLLKAGAPITEPERIFNAAKEGSFKRVLAWLSFIPDPNITNQEGQLAWEVYQRSYQYGKLSLPEQQHQMLLLEKILLERSLPRANSTVKPSRL